MSVTSFLIVAALVALVIGWLVLSSFNQPPIRRPGGRSYRTQHAENPDWIPGNVNAGGGGI